VPISKQVIILRKDLEMSVGKKCVQCCHASLGAYRKTKKPVIDKWLKNGEKKVIVSVSSKEEIMRLYKKSKENKLPCFLVKDAGLTELKPGTITALGIGPEEDKKIDKVTGELKLT
jgi:PTH2 family peptidyl-tRNA hydrolase